MKRARGGQPRTGKPAKNRLVVLLDDEEWAWLQKLAAGASSLSDYVRSKIFPRRKPK